MIFLAVDLGATSGRTILGCVDNGRVTQEELTRFDNPMEGCPLRWDLDHLFQEIVKALTLVGRRGIQLQSIGIDTWGVDVVCFDKNGQLLDNPQCYRNYSDPQLMEDYFAQKMPREEVYRRTGIQFMPFNTLFQLYDMRRSGDCNLEAANKILFIPDALSYLLTGNMVTERTIASTSQLLDPRIGQWDEALLQSVGLTPAHFGPIVEPGTQVGTLSKHLQQLTGLGPVPVVAVAGHDTASAVAAVPASNGQMAYLSSGTWSLMGIESPQPIISDASLQKNFTNEGGIMGTTRFLKNICGMWLYEQCRAQWKAQGLDGLEHLTLQNQAAQEESMRSVINPDHPSLAAPADMVQAIQQLCRQCGQPVPETHPQLVRCIFDSLAVRYREVMEWLQEFAPFPIQTLHIIGGGSQNASLCQLTADVLDITVLAGPAEGTALGNIMVQAQTAGLVDDIWEMRQVIANSIELTHYEPKKQ